MGNSLMIYLNKRLEESKNQSAKNHFTPGPVITISREVGCNGLKLAQQVAARLNERKFETDWKVLSKEVFYQSALELNMNPDRIHRIFKQTDKFVFDEILKAFSDKQYKSERKIIKTVADVVRSFAVDGFCIIVGRAGHILAKDIEHALHIRLIAPLEYRIRNIMENNRLNREEAIHFIDRVEKERIAFRKAICQEKMVEESYDICINRAAFDDNLIIDLIEFAVDKKNILGGYSRRENYY